MLLLNHGIHTKIAEEAKNVGSCVIQRNANNFTAFGEGRALRGHMTIIVYIFFLCSCCVACSKRLLGRSDYHGMGRLGYNENPFGKAYHSSLLASILKRNNRVVRFLRRAFTALSSTTHGAQIQENVRTWFRVEACICSHLLVYGSCYQYGRGQGITRRCLSKSFMTCHECMALQEYHPMCANTLGTSTDAILPQPQRFMGGKPRLTCEHEPLCPPLVHPA